MMANALTVDLLKGQRPYRGSLTSSECECSALTDSHGTEIRKLELRGKVEIKSSPDETIFTENT